MTNLITMNQTQTMSSKEIAELTGKRHDHVLRDVRTMLVTLYGLKEVDEGIPDKDTFEVFCDRMGWGIDSPKLGNERIQGVTVTRDARGFISEIGLDYTHSMTMVSGYNLKLRKVIVDRWQELEQVTQVVADTLQVDKEALIKSLKQDTTIKKLQASISASDAKIEASNLKLEALRTKHKQTMAILEAKTTKLLSQGAKVKGDMSVGKLTMPKSTITTLLKYHGSHIEPRDANYALVNLGYLESDRKTVTNDGSEFGTSNKSGNGKAQQAFWFDSEFPKLIKEIEAELIRINFLNQDGTYPED